MSQADPRCLFCGIVPAEHPASDCLDRWVHVQFLKESADDGSVPNYSSSADLAINNVAHAPRWPDGATLARRGVFVVVIAQAQTEEEVATATDVALAICRAAVSVKGGGDRELEFRQPPWDMLTS